MIPQRGASATHRRAGCALALIVGVGGVLAALALPFAPVITRQATVSWPVNGHPAASTTALFVPYRPAELTAMMPCRALEANQPTRSTTVLATGPPGDGLIIRTSPAGPELVLGNHVPLPLPVGAGHGCRVTIHAGRDGVTVSGSGGAAINLPDEPVPKVFGFRTDLDAVRADGITVTARTAGVFATRPGTLKTALVIGQLLATLAALALLHRHGRRHQPATSAAPRSPQPVNRRRLIGIDVAVVCVLAGWAVVGPLAVDDGWALMIAREYAATAQAGNYYRWWNASEIPFAFWQQLIAPLTRISLAPLWLRVPSTLLAVATWFTLSRGVLGAALPTTAPTVGVRLLAAVCLLGAWMPFNLGVRPESYVACAVTAVLALLWRARGLAALGWVALIVGLTVPISPTAVILAAPLIVFAPHLFTVLRTASAGRLDLLVHVLLLSCVAAIGVTVIFADQTWDGLLTATEWHRFFGPSLPWYHEPDRYHYLLGGGQQGSFAKRLPVLLTAALLPLVAALYFRGRATAGAAARLASVVVTALLVLSLVPSKWSYHLGVVAGLVAAFIVVTVMLVAQHARSPGHAKDAVIGLAGGGLVAGAAAISFAGPNAWWLPAVYDVPWASGAPRPLGMPVHSVMFWLALLIVVYAVTAALAAARGGGHVRRAMTAGPAVLGVIAIIAALGITLFSFAAAPIRRPSGSLALANLRWLTGRSGCALGDDIEVLQDGAILPAATPTGSSTGFTALGGFSPDSPPPDPPGSGMSTHLWGSRATGAANTATMTTAWFDLSALGPGHGLSVSISGGVAASVLTFEFGRVDPTPRLGAATDSTAILRQVIAHDALPPGDDADRRVWRAITVDAAQIPAHANRVRLRVDNAGRGPTDWLAVTGPRAHSVIALTRFLAGHGPVLISWPQSFLFPCVRNIAMVADGLAQTPRSVIVAPGPWFTEPTDQSLGGDFAALVPFGRLYQVPTRLAGHPDIDWGALLLADDTADAYQMHVADVPRPGHTDRQQLYQVQLPR